MKRLIINKSIHNGNTEKIAKRIANTLDADVVKPEEFDLGTIDNYDLIGFGSGIYGSKHHEMILDLVEDMPDLQGKKVFIFSTAGIIVTSDHDSLKRKLKEKNAIIVDDFFCKGFNENSFLRFFGGMNKGRPHEEDLRRAEDFARKIKTTFIDGEDK